MYKAHTEQSNSTEDRHLIVGDVETPSGLIKPQLLRESVRKAMNNYFSQFDNEEASEVYQLILSEVEAPLLDVVMRNSRGNQTKAARILGLNRGTLRKKLKKYNLS